MPQKRDKKIRNWENYDGVYKITRSGPCHCTDLKEKKNQSAKFCLQKSEKKIVFLMFSTKPLTH